MEEYRTELALELFSAGVLKFGDFLTKSGIRSPIYFDFRVIVSHPRLMEKVAGSFVTLLGDKSGVDLLCGVPYTALPIASVASVRSGIPMVMRRKEVKTHGTGKLIEGHFLKGQRCVIVEDVVTSGSSVAETARDLTAIGLTVDRALVILDRQQGAVGNLAEKDIRVESLYRIDEFLSILSEANKITDEMLERVRAYLKMTDAPLIAAPSRSRIEMDFSQRCDLAKNPIAKQLFRSMLVKQTNLCVAADLTSSTEILNLFRSIGPHVCMLKIHADIVVDFDSDFVKEMTELSKRHQVIVMEDRKYSDIGNTVKLQCSEGPQKVSSWADVVTVHSLSGPGIFDGIRECFSDKLKGVFVVAEMSSKGNLLKDKYIDDTIKMVNDNIDMVAGAVCQNGNVLKMPGLIQLTPGVKINESADNLGQNYNTPQNVIDDNGADIAVVGRGIIQSANPTEEAQKYRKILWDCYEKRIK